MKYVILSSDSNPDYYNLLPLVCYSWQKIGYTPVVYSVNIGVAINSLPGVELTAWPPVDGVKDSTIAQLSRLFAWQYFNDDDILITADADMVIAKNIFIDSPEVHSYGFDLTGRSELPICYVSASAANWRKLMGLYVVPDSARSQQWDTYWSTDQQLLTQRAREYGFDKITFVDRGNNNKHSLPTGRWDRYDWSNIPNDIIDVHMKRGSWDAQFEVCQRLWPDDGEPFSIVNAYRNSVDEQRSARQKELHRLEHEYPHWLEDCSNWSNHRPLLLLGLHLTGTKGVFEFGCGDGSTKYIRSYCYGKTRGFDSFESNEEWAEKCNSMPVKDWDELIKDSKNYPAHHFGLIFLDHAPGERRYQDAIALKDAADILVLHDTEEGGAGNYNWNEALKHFKYQLHYNRHGGGAGASMVSNTIDVTVYKGLMLGAFKFDD